MVTLAHERFQVGNQAVHGRYGLALPAQRSNHFSGIPAQLRAMQKYDNIGIVQ